MQTGDEGSATPVELVRSLYWAATVDGAPPFNTAHLKVFYPALYSNTPAENLSGTIPANPAKVPFPVVLFLPGINVNVDGYRWLAEHLAAEGYAVVLYAVIGVLRPGQVALHAGLDGAATTPQEHGSRPASSALAPILASLADLASAPGPLRGLLDLGRVVFGGHSAGGTVALQSASRAWFPALRAVFTYGAHTLGSESMGWPNGSVMPVASDCPPVLLLSGTRDGVIARSAVRYGENAVDREDPIARTFERALPAAARARSRLETIEGANHFGIVDPTDLTSARRFLDDDPVGDPAAHRATIAGEIVSFLAQHIGE